MLALEEKLKYQPAVQYAYTYDSIVMTTIMCTDSGLEIHCTSTVCTYSTLAHMRDGYSSRLVCMCIHQRAWGRG